MFSPWHCGRKQNSRVDKLFVIFLKISKGKMIDQIIKFEKVKISHAMTEMRARNKNKEGILGRHSYVIVSGLSLRQVKLRCHTLTTMFCQLHVPVSLPVIFVSFVCTCTDHLIKSLSCKHNHAVHMARKNVETKPVMEDNDCPDETHSEVLKSHVHQEAPAIYY